MKNKSYISSIRSKVGHDLVQIPGARAVLLNNNGQILLQERTDFKIWGLPAGSANVGESISDCAKREILEETGISVEILTPFGYSSSPEEERVQYPNQDIIHCYSLLLFTELTEEQLLMLNGDNDETLSLKFFDLNSLPEMLPNHKQTIEKFKQFQKTGEFQVS